MPTIKATKIEFKPGFPFRKFKNLNIPLASRITLLCGHNGVGKSTILGLLSSLSGLTQGSEKSYFGKLFDASIADIVYIDKFDSPLPVVFDCLVDKKENCFPMIPSGAAHNEMILSDAADELEEAEGDDEYDAAIDGDWWKVTGNEWFCARARIEERVPRGLIEALLNPKDEP